MAASSEAYQKPQIVSAELAPGEDTPTGLSMGGIEAVVVAVAVGTWIVAGVEAATYSRKRRPSERERRERRERERERIRAQAP